MKRGTLFPARHDLHERALPSEPFLDYVQAHRLDLFRIKGFAGVTAATPIIDCGNNRFDFDDHTSSKASSAKPSTRTAGR